MTAFSNETIDKVWEKARGATEPNAEIWRRDECGAWIKHDQYGHERSEFGWKIENVSLGGPDTPANLRALHHANSYDRASGRAKCHVTADQTATPVMEHIREPRNRKARAL